MKVEVEDVEEVIDKKVDSYSTSTRIIIPKKYANRRVKVLILKEVKRKWNGFVSKGLCTLSGSLLDEVPVRHPFCSETLQSTSQAREGRGWHEDGAQKEGSPEVGLWAPILGILEPWRLFSFWHVFSEWDPKCGFPDLTAASLRTLERQTYQEERRTGRDNGVEIRGELFLTRAKPTARQRRK